MASVVCSGCVHKITTESDRVYCFFGCDKILHTKCAEINLTGAKALKENPALRYICFDCRKNQLSINDVQSKCESVLKSVNELHSIQKSTIERIVNLERSIADSVSSSCEKVVSKCIEKLLTDLRDSACYVQHAVPNIAAGPSYAAVVQTGVPLSQRTENYKRKVADTYSQNSAKKLKPNSADDDVANDEGQWLRSGKRRNRIIQSTHLKATSVESSIRTPIGRPKPSQVPKMNRTVVIKPKVSQDVDTTKSEIKSNLDPVVHAVKDVFFNDNGNAIIRCDSQQSALKLIDSAQSSLGTKYEIGIQTALRPRVKIVGFSEVMQDEFISKLLKQNNLPDNAELKVVRFTKSKKLKDNPMSVVLEVDACTFKILLNAKYVNIEWERCPVFESIDVLRCFRCSEFGHIAANCNKPFCCPKCTECHEATECMSEYEKCINCTIANKAQNVPADQQLEVNHCSWSNECPVYLKRLEKSRQRIDYST